MLKLSPLPISFMETENTRIGEDLRGQGTQPSPVSDAIIEVGGGGGICLSPGLTMEELGWNQVTEAL